MQRIVIVYAAGLDAAHAAAGRVHAERLGRRQSLKRKAVVSAECRLNRFHRNREMRP